MPMAGQCYGIVRAAWPDPIIRDSGNGVSLSTAGEIGRGLARLQRVRDHASRLSASEVGVKALHHYHGAGCRPWQSLP